MNVVYTAAHGGFTSQHVPLGGGGAVCDMLVREWAAAGIPVSLFRPEHLSGSAIVNFSTAEYARFSRDFEQASTAFIERHPSGEVAVLANDIAEGPDFRKLGETGYRIATVWHVDVVDYVASIYCRGLIAPETLVRLHRAFGPVCPDILRLIFEKQADCVRYSAAHIVPSPAMKETILRCYPGTPPEKIHVVPWGTPPLDSPLPAPADARRSLQLPAGALVLLTLSRLSPEKNQQLLLDALARWERMTDFPSRPVHVLLCGAAAFMQGKKHEAMLREKAARLEKTVVHFPGYVHGPRKAEHLAAADLYVFPSKHESYGLTLMEAFAAGLPALTLDHAGARAVMQSDFGAIANEESFLDSLRALARSDLARLGKAAHQFAIARPFSQSAVEVSAILRRI